MKPQQWGGLRPSRAVLPEKKEFYKFVVNVLSQFPCNVLSVLLIVVNTERLKPVSPTWYSVLCFSFFLFSCPGHRTLVVRVKGKVFLLQARCGPEGG